MHYFNYTQKCVLCHVRETKLEYVPYYTYIIHTHLWKPIFARNVLHYEIKSQIFMKRYGIFKVRAVSVRI